MIERTRKKTKDVRWRWGWNEKENLIWRGKQESRNVWWQIVQDVFYEAPFRCIALTIGSVHRPYWAICSPGSQYNALDNITPLSFSRSSYISLSLFLSLSSKKAKNKLTSGDVQVVKRKRNKMKGGRRKGKEREFEQAWVVNAGWKTSHMKCQREFLNLLQL